jgi:ABC-type sugar transport system ATPase subunit
MNTRWDDSAARTRLSSLRIPFDRPVATLSGGQRSQVALSLALSKQPDILFLDDPTRGIDVAAKQDIYRIVDELAAAGKAVILVSSELPELLRLSDRILVLNQGRIAGHFQAADATQESIMSAAAEVRA